MQLRYAKIWYSNQDCILYVTAFWVKVASTIIVISPVMRRVCGVADTFRRRWHVYCLVTCRIFTEALAPQGMNMRSIIIRIMTLGRGRDMMALLGASKNVYLGNFFRHFNIFFARKENGEVQQKPSEWFDSKYSSQYMYKELKCSHWWLNKLFVYCI